MIGENTIEKQIMLKEIGNKEKEKEKVNKASIFCQNNFGFGESVIPYQIIIPYLKFLILPIS